MSPGINRQKSMFWRKVPVPKSSVENAQASFENTTQRSLKSQAFTTADSSKYPHEHALVSVQDNQKLRDYEVLTKAGFDKVERLLQHLSHQQHHHDFVDQAQRLALDELGVEWPDDLLKNAWKTGLDIKALFGFGVFKQFEKLSRDFYQSCPLWDEDQQALAQQAMMAAGFHAVGIAPCADGRLAHAVSYVLRLPYNQVRRKAHAGAMFDISESVRHWVFVEHDRFREGLPNPASESTRYLKIAVYHYSEKSPSHQGCAAHGSDEGKAAAVALQRLLDFQQAIENRFGCGSRVEPMLLGLNTDNDSLKVHLPNSDGELSLQRYLKTETLFDQSLGWSAKQARNFIKEAIDQHCIAAGASQPQTSMRDLIAWLIEQNFSQIAYVRAYEKGSYADLGHAERFIGLGNGFEEVQLRNLSYYSYLDTLEEGACDVDVGLKIFGHLNIQHGLPAPVIIRCDYDGRVPGSKHRAVEKAQRIDQALHQRYASLSDQGDLVSLCTLRDHQSPVPCEVVRMHLSPKWSEQYEV